MPDDTPLHNPDPPTGRGLPRLLDIMRRLRDPDMGCPWDIEQDFGTIAPYTIEEAYEVADAIEREAWGELKDELGDHLLQVVLHAHIFGNERRDKSAEQQTRDWETVKAAERAAISHTGVLDGVALGLPALMRAVKLQKRAARVGFDWPDATHVLDKIQEEAAELTEAAETLPQDKIEEEMGDLLFVMANLARHMKVDPEVALRKTNAKFTRRFKSIEAALAAEGRRPDEASLEEMDRLWDAAKTAERSG